MNTLKWFNWRRVRQKKTKTKTLTNELNIMMCSHRHTSIKWRSYYCKMQLQSEKTRGVCFKLSYMSYFLSESLYKRHLNIYESYLWNKNTKKKAQNWPDTTFQSQSETTTTKFLFTKTTIKNVAISLSLVFGVVLYVFIVDFTRNLIVFQ